MVDHEEIAGCAALASLCDAVGAGWLRIGPDLRVRAVSALAARILDVDPEDVIGQNCITAVRCQRCVAGCPAKPGAPLDEVIDVFTRSGPRHLRRMVFPVGDGSRETLEVLMPAVRPVVEPASAQAPARVGAFTTAEPSVQRELERATLLAKRGVLRLVQGPCPQEREALVRAAFGLCSAPGRVAAYPARVVVREGGLVLPAQLARGEAAESEGPAVILLEDIDRLEWSDQLAIVALLRDGHRAVEGRLPVVAGLRGSLEDAMRTGAIDPLVGRALKPGRVVLTPVRSRPADVALRCREQFAKLGNGSPATVTEAAWSALLAHTWPGELAELEAVVHTAFALASGRVIDVEHLPDELRGAAARPLSPDSREYAAVALSAQRVRAAILAADGNLAVAAETLGISRATLWRWRKRLGLA